jgi:hypothetical protein
VRPTHHQFLTSELQRLYQEPLSEPSARAREGWKPLREAMERLDNARVQASYDTEVSLRVELSLAKQRDQL